MGSRASQHCPDMLLGFPPFKPLSIPGTPADPWLLSTPRGHLPSPLQASRLLQATEQVLTTGGLKGPGSTVPASQGH